jgi:hypothetical protein
VRTVDVHFNEINGQIKVADTESLLTQQLLSRIVSEVMAQIALKERHKQNLDQDTRLRRRAIEPPERVA